VRRLLLLGSAPIDHFDAKSLRIARDGRLLGVSRALLVQTYGSTMQLTGVQRVRHELIFDLYRVTGTPRVRLIAAGRYADAWLAPRGVITVWSRHGGTLELTVSMPPGTQVTPVRFGKRLVRVHPGRRMRLDFRVPGGGPWNLHFRSSKQGYLGDRGVSVKAPVVRFVG
jgi:hypothetical protein